MEFIGFHCTKNHIVSSEGHQLDIPLYLDDFFPICEGKTAVFYDLDYSVAVICKLLELTQQECKKLLVKGRIFLPPFEISYYPERFFSVDRIGGKLHPFTNFFNMNQTGYLESHYTNDNSIEDSINKAKEAKQTAEAVYQVFQKLDLHNTIVSPSSAFLKKYTFNWATVDDLPVEISQLAYEAVTGQWFEAMQLGHWNNDNGNGIAFDYDLNASFLAIMANLLDIRRGEWIHTDNMSSQLLRDAFYGIATGDLSIETGFHPFTKKIGKDNYTLTGTYPKLMTIQDLRFLDKWKQGNYKMTDGYFWLPKGQQNQPYRGAMMYLWNKKQQVTSQREKLIVQRIYSSIYGITLQQNESTGFGKMFNPIIGLTTLNTNALQVADACLSSGIIPLAVMADGFVSDRPANVPISKEMGQWKLNAKGKCLIAGTSAVVFENDKEVAELAISYNDLIQQIKDNPTATEYKRTRISPVTLALALDKDFESLGELKPIERKLRIGKEAKRHYETKPKTGRELISGKHYPSMAWDCSYILRNN